MDSKKQKNETKRTVLKLSKDKMKVIPISKKPEDGCDNWDYCGNIADEESVEIDGGIYDSLCNKCIKEMRGEG